MEITKKHWTIIGIVIGALAIYYFFIRKNKMSVESGYADEGTHGTAGCCNCPANLGYGCRTGCCSNLVKKRGATMSVESGYRKGGPIPGGGPPTEPVVVVPR